jgi:hypothetical protein
VNGILAAQAFEDVADGIIDEFLRIGRVQVFERQRRDAGACRRAADSCETMAFTVYLLIGADGSMLSFRRPDDKTM